MARPCVWVHYFLFYFARNWSNKKFSENWGTLPSIGYISEVVSVSVSSSRKYGKQDQSLIL